MEKYTFRELSFYFYLNDVKEKLLFNLVAKCFFFIIFSMESQYLEKKILIPKCIIFSDISITQKKSEISWWFRFTL